ncbi:MAG TPA: hypothetical protein ENI79_02285 [Rhodospirillales bacterium]|nr:hypothetical protein [Rhodospirillales bacterium]
MQYSLAQTVAPTDPVLTADDFQEHTRETDNFEEALLADRYIPAATVWCQDACSRQFINATWEFKLPRFPSGDETEWPLEGYDLLIPIAPLSSVASIIYLDPDGASQTLASSVYSDDTASKPPRINLAYGQAWPAIRHWNLPITITLVAGYGTSASDVPENFRQAVRYVTTGLFEHRGQLPEYIEQAARSMLFTDSPILMSAL